MILAARQSLWNRHGQIQLVGCLFPKQSFAYANVGSPNGKQALSFGGWFKLIQKSSEGKYLVCGWNQTGGWGSTHIVENSFRFGTGSSATYFPYSFGYLLEDQWIHCVASYNGQNADFFLNGILEESHNVGSISMTNNDSIFRIAAFNEGSMKYSSIACCNVFVLNRGTTQQEVQKMMKMQSMQSLASDTSLVEAWNFKDISSGVVQGVKNQYAMTISGQVQNIDGPIV